MSVYTI